MARPGIILYFDILEPIRVLSDADKGRLLVAMLEYGQYGTLPQFDGMLALAWGFVLPKLDRDEESYENAKVQRQYAAFCKRRNSRGLSKIPFEQWQQMNPEERKRMSTEDNEPLRAVDFVNGRNPSTTTTATASTATTTTATTTAAAAVTTTAGADFAAAAAEKKVKMLVYATEDERTRIKLAATKLNMSMTEFILDSVMEQVASVEALESKEGGQV